MANNMADDVLTTTEAARLLGISVRTAQLLIENGGLPSWKTPGGHRRVHRADVAALLPAAQSQGHLSSPTVLVITSEARRPEIAAQLGTGGYFSVQFQTDLWSAALAAGQRPPGIVVVDLRVWGSSGVGLLNTLANDGRFKQAVLIGLDAAAAQATLLPSPSLRVPLKALDTTVLETLRGTGVPTEILAEGFPVAPNESNRLAAVQRTGLVDTAPEASFDRLTTLAADNLRSPVALMTVLTPQRQWFKSRHGLEMSETPRSWAFCNHTVLQRDVFEVGDLADDSTFNANPAVAGAPHFRHYAGAPFYDPDGFALGSICVMDYRPRTLNTTQRRTLLHLAAIATDAVKLRDVSVKH
jgi:excisionase family DNA binding protein